MKRISGPQSGNVIFIILIGIVLFAALSYAVTQSMRDSVDAGGNEKTSVQVSDILTYANSINTTVKALMANGCTDTQISFENPTVTGYANAGAPADKSCNVFDAAGGGLRYIVPVADMLDKNFSADPNYGQFVFTAKNCLFNVGTGGSSCSTSNAELGMILSAVTKNICSKVISGFGMTYIPSNGSSISKFAGVYPGSPVLMSSNTTVDGQKILCYQYNGEYFLYFTLLAR